MSTLESDVTPGLRPSGLYGRKPGGNERAPLDPKSAEGRMLTKMSERRLSALQDRRNYEPIWHICQAFVASRQWVAWAAGSSTRSGRVVTEPNPQKRERHTVNVLTQYLNTVMGKLYVEDLRPELLFTQADVEARDIVEHTRHVGRYLWDEELCADEQVFKMLTKMLTYGTAYLHCTRDPTKGNPLGEFPVGPDGIPIVDAMRAREYVMMAAQSGEQVKFMTLREGRLQWKPLSPFEVLPPPGVEYSDDFPWVITEVAKPVGWAKQRFPDRADDISEEENLVTSASYGVRTEIAPSEVDSSPYALSRLREHFMVSSCYENPTQEYPNGRVIHWNENRQVLLGTDEALPYRLGDDPHHGIIDFHYHRLAGRFLSQGLIEPLVGPQRQRNRARSQMIEMKDRNLGRVYARKGTITQVNKPVGKIMELVEVPLHSDYPVETQGVPPGPWIENEARLNDEDMQIVAGLNDVSFGQTPQGVSAYSALALLAEQDERRVGAVLKNIRTGISKTMKISLETARRYWPEGKHMGIAGQEGQVELFTFRRAKLPLVFYMSVSSHAPLPTSPAVESQKIFDIFHSATAAGQPLPVDWLKGSLDQGKALPIPKREQEVQVGKAEHENLMLSEGMPIIPAYYDDDFIHIEVHRIAQTEALQSGNEPLNQMLEMHIQMHVQNAQMKMPNAASAGSGVPQMQGPRGIEAQNSPQANPEGAAQAAAVQGGVMPGPQGV